MNKDRIKYLIDRFNRGELDETGFRELEGYIESGAMDPREIPSLNTLYEQLDSIRAEPGRRMDEGFYSMLNQAIREQPGGSAKGLFSWKGLSFWRIFTPRLVMASMMVLVGFGLGTIFMVNLNREEINRLSGELDRMQQTVTLALLEKPSASERLKAISLSTGLNESDEKVIHALLKTLNQDENVNVRLAAIDALISYAGNEKVRLGLIESISRQDLPIVQVALADAMVLIQEKRSIGPMKELMDKEETDEAVRDKLAKSINRLI